MPEARSSVVSALDDVQSHVGEDQPRLSGHRSLNDPCSVAVDEIGLRPRTNLRLLRRLVFGFLLERFPDGFVTDKPLFGRRQLTRRIKRRVAVRNFGGGFLFLAHKVTSISNSSHQRRVDIRARMDRPARSCLFVRCVAHGQYLERKDDLPAAKRIVAIDRQCLVVHLRHEEAAGLTLVVLHEDGGADLPILLGDVLDVIGKNQRLVPGAEDLIAVDRHFDDVARGLALQLPMDRRGQDFVVSVNIAQREFDPGEDMPRLLVGHLVGELDELAVGCLANGFQKMDAPKILTLSILIAEDQPAKPFARLLGAALPVKNRHMLAPADDAEGVDVLGQASRQLAVGELVAGHHLIHGKRQGTGEVPREFPVLAFVRILDEVAPQGIGDGENLLVGLFDDVHARLSASGRDRLHGGRCYSLSATR